MIIVEYEFLSGSIMTKNHRSFCNVSEETACAKLKKQYASFEKFKILSVRTTMDKADIKAMISEELDGAMYFVDGYYGDAAKDTFAHIKDLVNELS